MAVPTASGSFNGSSGSVKGGNGRFRADPVLVASYKWGDPGP